MEIQDKVVVVTGAASGIGKSLAVRFRAEGAKQIGGIAMRADVGVEADVASVIERTEADVGPIELFCSNAGVALGADLEAPNGEWRTSWHVNVMSHVYAARHVVPRMIARGGGYFLITASAAGLLNQIGLAAYGVTKHAAVGFGEWLASCTGCAKRGS